MSKVLYIFGAIVFMLFSVNLTKEITKRYKVNRWILAFTSPLILIIPLIFFKGLSQWVWIILFLIFSFTCIMFFEITRVMVEENKLKGVAKFPELKKKK